MNVSLLSYYREEHVSLEVMIESIWSEWKKTTDEFKETALSVRQRILTKTKNSPTAVQRLARIDATVCVMLSLQVIHESIRYISIKIYCDTNV